MRQVYIVKTRFFFFIISNITIYARRVDVDEQ